MLTTALLLMAPMQAASQDAMPGLVPVHAGKTRLGAREEHTRALIASKPNDAQGLGSWVGNATPVVPAFYISPTEVTNEMYLRFVEDTGAMPPASWAQIDRELRLEIIRALQAETAGAKFDDHQRGIWWEENWGLGKVEWSVPPDQKLMPVGYISYLDAVEYCVWAGLRLPTEIEWVRSARSDQMDFEFPFGEEFDETKVAFEATKPRGLGYKALPVAALDNASPFGCVDMVGNMWEWTDSGFSRLSGFASFEVETKVGRLPISPTFDASLKVIKGGSYTNPDFVCSIDSRTGIQKDFRASILGFRVASSTQPVWNAAHYAIHKVSGNVLKGMPERRLDVDRVIGFEKREVVPDSELTGSRAAPADPLPASKIPADYRVFKRYQCVGIIPIRELEIRKGRLAKEVEEEGLFPVGVLHTTVAMEKANLLPGTYALMYIPPLEAETILDLGANVPPNKMPKKYEPKEPKGDEVPIKDLWGVSIEGLTLEPDSEYLLAVTQETPSSDPVGVGLFDLVRSPKFGRAKSAKHEVTLNLNKDRLGLIFSIPVPETRDAWTFHVALHPRDKDGGLVRKSAWDGDYFRVVEIVED